VNISVNIWAVTFIDN